MSEFKVQGRLGLDGAGFFSTLNRAQSAVGSFGSMLAGAFSVGAITAFSKSVLDLAGNLNDVSEALSLNVEYLQRFLNSARQSGGSLGDIEKFLFESNKSRQAALDNPAGKEAAAFSRLGFSSSQIANANPQQFIDQIIKAFANGATPQDLNALAEIGGKSAKKLVGGFKDGLDEATVIMTKETVAQLDEIGDRFTSLATTLKTVFAPAILWTVKALQAFGDAASVLKSFIGSGFDGSTVTKELLSQVERDRKLASSQASKSSIKSAAENANATFSPDAKGKPESNLDNALKFSGVGLGGDSLLSVGNFLGAGRTASLQSIAERHLYVAQQTLEVQRSILTKVGVDGNNLSISW